MAEIDYVYKSDPYQHQDEDFIATRDETNWALLYEMGLGKSKVTIDTVAWNYARGVIDFFLLIAPNGVHEQWVNDELPAHMPDFTNYIAASWFSNMRKPEQAAVDAVFEGYKSHPRLRILTMNIEAFQTPDRYYREKAHKLVRAILNVFNVLMAVDESSDIKTPGATRTKRVITLGQHAVMRRILNGTPITTGPLDAYSQFKFLQGGGMRPQHDQLLLGPESQNFTTFKNHYAEYEERERRDGRRYPALVGYRNVEELSNWMATCSTRRLKKDCLDLPEKTYEKIPVELHKKQADRYKALKEEGVLRLRDGHETNVANVLEMWLRLQQIVGGFVPTDNPEDSEAECLFDSFEDIPRVQVYLRYIEQVQSGKILIACRFISEAQGWMNYLGDQAVSYIGKTHYDDPADREANKVRFQGTKENGFEDHDPNVRFMVINKAGYRGHTFTQAQAMFFYSNDFSLDKRLQAEDRPHRIGQTNVVTYFDGIAKGTIDEKLVDAYRERKRLADIINKDDPATWV